MKSVNIAWVFACVSAISMGMAAEACSSSSTTVTGSSSTATTGSSSTISMTSSSSTVTTSSSSSCHKAPPALHAEDGGAGVYCPFSGSFDGGKDINCTIGEHCCEPTTDGVLSTCSPLADECTGGATDWQCEGTPDCAGTPGTVCCGTGVINPQAACGDVAAYSYVSGFEGAKCATSCPDFQVCSKDSECPGGATGSCQAIEPKGNGIGYCAGGGGGSSSSVTSSSSAASTTASSSGTSSSGASSASSSASASTSASGSGS